MITKQDLSNQCRSIIDTLSMLVQHYGENFKLPVDKINKKPIEKHLKLFGLVGLVHEYNEKENYFSVTVSADTFGFYCFHINEIETVQEGLTHDQIIKAFNKMFPQDKDHCSNCCPYDLEDEDESDY